MKVIYSIGGCVVGGSGIGRIAYHAVKGIERHGLLHQLIVNRVAPTANLDPSVVTRIPSHIPGLRRILSSRFVNAIGDTSHGCLSNLVMKDGDVFHGWAGMALPAMRKAKKRGMRLVLERASTHILEQKRTLESEYWLRKEPFNNYLNWHISRELAEYELADLIVVPSAFVKDSFLAQGFDEKKIIVIPFGTDLSKQQKKVERSSDGPLNGVFVGEVGFRKGILYALEGWQKANFNKGTFFVAGPITEEIKPWLEKYKNDPTIVFTGFVDPQPLYDQADVFIFPSLEEGSALVTYEAMANGLPLLVTKNTGSVITDRKEGIVVAAQSSDSVKNTLEELASNRAMSQRLGQQAYQTVQSYSWESYGDKVAQVYSLL